jgi:maltose O-acetyltransferase
MLHLLSKIILKIYILLKRAIFDWLSDIKIDNKTVKIYQPQLRNGKGKIICGKNVQFGIPKRKGYYDSITYINLRKSTSKLIIDDDVTVNNSFSVTSAGGTIFIGKKTLIGNNVSIFDADFHPITPENRLSTNFSVKDVRIGDNVWIENDCKILKGVNIGDNSIIAINSVVKNDIPGNCIAAGNPAMVVKQIEI